MAKRYIMTPGPQVGQTAAVRQRGVRERAATVQRKVRAPQDTVVGNAHRPRPLLRGQGQGECNRKHTADGEPVDGKLRQG